MIFKTFRFQVVARTLAALFFIVGAMYIWLDTDFWLVGVWLVFFGIMAIVSLIYYVERNIRDLINFLESLKNQDFSLSFNAKKKRGFQREFYHVLNTISKEFQNVRKERESNYHFLQATLEQSGVPLFTYHLDTEKILFYNEAFKVLIDKPYLSSLSSIKNINKEIYELVLNLNNEERQLLNTRLNDQPLSLLFTSKRLIIKEENYKLIAIHDIRDELEQNEIESWSKLIRVLTHEIKNSVIPISTLSEVIAQMIEHTEFKALDAEDEEDIRKSIQTIEKRSKGLVSFVNSYSDLARLPKPKLDKVSLNNLLDEVYQLIKEDYKKEGIAINVKLERETKLFIDHEMIEQVLLNLLKNAREAFNGQEEKSVMIKCKKVRGYHQIHILDNGSGIPEDLLENIFIPFFTTKKEGSGVGLSLSRQLLRAHGGYLKARNNPGGGAEFILGIRKY